jgi:hypothetical protein
MQQQLAADGVTLTNGPIKLLDRGDADRPPIEGPNMILVNGGYILFSAATTTRQHCMMCTMRLIHL